MNTLIDFLKNTLKYKKIFFILLLTLCHTSLASFCLSANQQKLLSIRNEDAKNELRWAMDCSCKLRAPTFESLNSHWQSERESHEEIKIYREIRDFSSSTIQDSILEFIDNSFALDIDDLSLKAIELNRNFKARGGVFLLSSNKCSNSPTIAVKVVIHQPEVSHNIIKELSGYSLLETSTLKDTFCTFPLAIGKAQVEDLKMFFLALPLAPGWELWKYVDRAQELKLSNPERANAFYKVGRSLAQLHMQKSLDCASAPTHVHHIIRNRKRRLMEKLQEVTELVHFPKLSQTLEKFLEQELSRPCTLRLTHGDAHLGNFFFDMQSNTPTIIDPCNTHRSINIYDQPAGIASQDIARVVEHIELRTASTISNEEFENMYSAFIQGYEEVLGSPDHLYTVFEAFLKINRLHSVAQDIKNQRANLGHYNLFTRYKTWIEEFIHQYGE